MGFDVKQEVTNRIIAQLEKGIIPWHKPWFGTNSAISRITGKNYSLINQCLLGQPGEYLTYKQVTDLGGKVKKGEKAHFVVFWKPYFKKEKDEKTGEEKEIFIPVLKYFNVFNLDQCEGIEGKYLKTFETDSSDDDEAENLIYDYLERENIDLETRKGDTAKYDSVTDKIICPEASQFASVEEYFSTMFGLLIRSTRNKERIDREDNKDGTRENLVAEIGAAMLCNIAGLETEKTFDNSVGYIQKWIGYIAEDKNLILSACTRAERAVEFILNGKGAEDAA